jgi:hypothetical protein
MSRALVRLLALSLLPLLFVSGAARAAGAQIELLGDPAAKGEPLDLRVRDRWPSTCTPELSSVEVRGLEIWILAREAGDRRSCIERVSEYSLETRLSPKGFAVLEAVGVHRVHFAVLTSTGTRLRGFRLLPVGLESVDSEAPESGYWWADPDAPQEFAGPGIGLNLERQGSILSAVVFGYDFEGRPEWTLASGPLGPGFSELSLSRLAQGSGPRGAYQRPRQVDSIGSLWLQPHGPGHASVWLAFMDSEHADLDLRRLEITRFSFAKSTAESWRGRWLLVVPEEADRLQAHELNLSELRPMLEGFALSSRDGSAELLCVNAEGGADGLPQQCQLSLADSARPIEFDRFGLRQLQGDDDQGLQVRLISLDNN